MTTMNRDFKEPLLEFCAHKTLQISNDLNRIPHPKV